jgi:two-component system response regulator AdeR
MSENLTVWFGSNKIQSSENRITIPKQAFKLGIVERGLPVYWFVEEESERVTISKKVVTDGGNRVDKINRQQDMERVDHTTVGNNRVVTVPKMFFPDFKGKAKGSRPLPEKVRLERKKECHFLTSRDLWERRACCIIQNDSVISQIMENRDENLLTDGGNKSKSLSMPDLNKDEVLILETGEIMNIESVRSLLKSSVTVDDDQPVVLIIDDEPTVAEMYGRCLQNDYTVRIATSGSEGLHKLDHSVEVILLDRQMPGLSGNEVLERIRSKDIDCRVAVVSAVDPDFGILDMRFDTYLTKPVTGDQLIETVGDLIARASYDDRLQELYSLIEKRKLLETSKSTSELNSHPKYMELLEQIDQLRNELSDSIDLNKYDEHIRI